MSGNDSVQVHKIHGPATLGALTGLVDGNRFRVALSNFETQYVFWAPDEMLPLGEPQSAVLNGTVGNDWAYQFDTHAIMQGSLNGAAYFNEVIGFARGTSFYGSGGDDSLISSPNATPLPPMHLSINATTRVSSLTRGNLASPGFVSSNNFSEFESLYAYANAFGQPMTTCSYVGTAGSDTFYGLPDTSILSSQGIFYQTIGYDSVEADLGGGVDTAVLYASADADVLEASPDVTTLIRVPAFRRNIVRNAESVYAFATAGGNDRASISDQTSSGAGNDVLFATSEYSLLYRPGSYLIQAIGFANVEVTSSTGYDTAIILDRPGGNQLTAMSDGVEMNYYGKSRVTIKAFDIVYANGLYGGVNRKVTTATPLFPIVYAGTWIG
ncbi:MAG: hypothetical protein JNM18_05220 [Planctomycetaceae bacterium]|nr:hypothetical protein [Planctomycetaceae bacterium]